MSDPLENNERSLMVPLGKKTEALPFTESEYNFAAQELGIRKSQLSRCKHLATLGQSTNFISKHDQNLGTLVWEREHIMDDVGRVDKILDANDTAPPEEKVTLKDVIKLLTLKTTLYRVISDSVVPHLEHLGDLKEEEDKNARRNKSFAPNVNIMVNPPEQKRNGNSRILVAETES